MPCPRREINARLEPCNGTSGRWTDFRLVDRSDLYHPGLIPLLGLKNGPGLAECLIEGLNPFSALRQVGPLGWYLLPAGNPPENPGELLHGEAFSKTMQTLAPYFDWILIDSPPVALSPTRSR